VGVEGEEGRVNKGIVVVKGEEVEVGVSVEEMCQDSMARMSKVASLKTKMTRSVVKRWGECVDNVDNVDTKDFSSCVVVQYLFVLNWTTAYPYRQFELETSEICQAFLKANKAEELPGFDTTAGIHTLFRRS
jgi:hypothetical protein